MSPIAGSFAGVADRGWGQFIPGGKTGPYFIASWDAPHVTLDQALSDSNGNIYASFYYTAQSSSEQGLYFVVKFDKDMKVQWQKRFLAFAGSDPNGTLYVGRDDYVYLTRSLDRALTKISPDGSVVWYGVFDTENSLNGVYVNFNNTRIYDLEVDTAGNIYVATTYGIARINANGSTQWSKVVYESGLSFINCRAIKKLGSHLYLAGHDASGKVILSRFDTSDGSLTWARRISLGTPSLFPHRRGLSYDGAGNIYLSAYQSGASSYYIKLDDTGSSATITWQRKSDSGYTGLLHLDAAGYPFISVTKDASPSEFHTMKLDDTTGAKVFSRKMTTDADFQAQNLDLYNFDTDKILASTTEFFVRMPEDGTKTGSYLYDKFSGKTFTMTWATDGGFNVDTTSLTINTPTIYVGTVSYYSGSISTGGITYATDYKFKTLTI